MAQQKATAKLLIKGYSIEEGVNALGICLRTYRNWIKNKPDFLDRLIDTLPNIEDKDEHT